MRLTGILGDEWGIVPTPKGMKSTPGRGFPVREKPDCGGGRLDNDSRDHDHVVMLNQMNHSLPSWAQAHIEHPGSRRSVGAIPEPLLHLSGASDGCRAVRTF